MRRLDFFRALPARRAARKMRVDPLEFLRRAFVLKEGVELFVVLVRAGGIAAGRTVYLIDQIGHRFHGGCLAISFSTAIPIPFPGLQSEVHGSNMRRTFRLAYAHAFAKHVERTAVDCARVAQLYSQVRRDLLGGKARQTSLNGVPLPVR